jgi:hypothetical protein
MHPDDTLELSLRMDSLITELVNDIAGFDIDAIPFGTERKRLLLTMGGLGLCAREPLRDAAFASTVAKVIPQLLPSISNTGATRPGLYNTPHINRLVGSGSFDGDAHVRCSSRRARCSGVRSTNQSIVSSSVVSVDLAQRWG